MAGSNTKLNLVFGLLAVVLAATAGVTMYQNRNMPAIRDAPPAAQLPENHPPVDGAGRMATLEQMSAAQPENAALKAQVGNAYYDSGQYARAAEAYEESLRLRPQEPAVETDLATCYHLTGRSDRALELLDRVLSYREDFPQALFNKGVVLLARQDTKGATAVWERLLAVHPDFPQKTDLEQRLTQLKGGLR